MNFRSKWALVLVMFPTLILSVFGIWFYIITQQEQQKTDQTRRLLLEQYPVWQKAVNEYVLKDKDQSISPSEAQELLLRQQNLKKDSLYLSVDSLIVQRVVDKDSQAFVYNYSSVIIEKRTMRQGDIIHDARYIVNNRKEVLGLTHNQTGYLLILQTALQVLRNGQMQSGRLTQPSFYNANLCINDAIINQRVSLIGLDTTGKYLIQLSSRMPDITYNNDNNKIAIPQSLYNLLKWFLGISWLLLITTIVTYFLYQHILRLSIAAHRWLNSLNKATCAIAIADKKGVLRYVNETYKVWNSKSAVEDTQRIPDVSESGHEGLLHKNLDTSLYSDGQNLATLSINHIVRNVIAQPGKTEYFNTVLGDKNVHSGITYDEETESLIIVDTDVSALRNMYDGELHSLKNLIQEVKELNARIILGDVPVEETAQVMDILKNNNHTLEKALLFYENNRGALTSSTTSDFIPYDLELGLDRIVRWFDSLVIPLNIRFDIQIPGIEVIGTLHSIELVFHNAIFNAIQAIREAGNDGDRCIRISAMVDNGWVNVSVADNGNPFQVYGDIQAVIEKSNGYGLKIIQGEMEKIGGRLMGIKQESNGFKSLQLQFKNA